MATFFRNFQAIFSIRIGPIFSLALKYHGYMVTLIAEDHKTCRFII